MKGGGIFTYADFQKFLHSRFPYVYQDRGRETESFLGREPYMFHMILGIHKMTGDDLPTLHDQYVLPHRDVCTKPKDREKIQKIMQEIIDRCTSSLREYLNKQSGKVIIANPFYTTEDEFHGELRNLQDLQYGKEEEAQPSLTNPAGLAVGRPARGYYPTKNEQQQPDRMGDEIEIESFLREMGQSTQKVAGGVASPMSELSSPAHSSPSPRSHRGRRRAPDTGGAATGEVKNEIVEYLKSIEDADFEGNMIDIDSTDGTDLNSVLVEFGIDVKNKSVRKIVKKQVKKLKTDEEEISFENFAELYLFICGKLRMTPSIPQLVSASTEVDWSGADL
jgi:hypothetical protein